MAADKKTDFNTDYEKWTPEDRAAADKALALVDGIKLYKSAGGAGVANQFAPHAQQLVARGGLSPDEATQLARYKMWKQTTGNDPNWQGPTNVPTGPRAPADTPEAIDARREQFFAAGSEDRGKMVAESKLANDRSSEGQYDDLVQKAPAAEPVRTEVSYPEHKPMQAGPDATDDQRLGTAQLNMMQGMWQGPPQQEQAPSSAPSDISGESDNYVSPKLQANLRRLMQYGQ